MSSSAKQYCKILFCWQVFLCDLCADLCVFARNCLFLVWLRLGCAKPFAVFLRLIRKQTADDAKVRNTSEPQPNRERFSQRRKGRKEKVARRTKLNGFGWQKIEAFRATNTPSSGDRTPPCFVPAPGALSFPEHPSRNKRVSSKGVAQ